MRKIWIGKGMRVLVHDYAGHPFQIQLSRELAYRGHYIHHLYAGYNQTPRGSVQPKQDDPSGFSVESVYINQPLDKGHFLRRWFQEREYGNRLVNEISKITPDVILCANTPLDSLRYVLAYVEQHHIPIIYWLQDYLGIGMNSILSTKLPIIGGIIGAYYLRLEARFLHQSDAVIPISEDFVPRLKSLNIPSDRIEVVPNWAPLEELPQLQKQNGWAREQDLSDAFRFTYTGTLGMKHNPQILLELAKECRFLTPPAEFLVASEGEGVEWLQAQGETAGLTTLHVLGFQPMSCYPKVLASADVLVAILEKEAGVFSVPSKVLSYLCAGRPLMLAVPRENLAARIVEQNEAGLVVEPEDVEGFLQAARRLQGEPDLRQRMGHNARRYAEKNFNIERIADRFEEVIRKVL